MTESTAQPLQHAPDPDRTRARTRVGVNQWIDHRTRLRIHEASRLTDEDLAVLIGEVGHEWDFDRVVEVEAAITGLTGLVLGAVKDSRFFLMPALAGGMMLVHALHGWYPILPLLRRLGLRSQDEIDREYYALKALRGDFDSVARASNEKRAEAAWRAVNL